MGLSLRAISTEVGRRGNLYDSLRHKWRLPRRYAPRNDRTSFQRKLESRGEKGTRGYYTFDKVKRKIMERKTGFEPATSSLARRHSTTELLPLAFLWCRGPELNWGHADFQSAALPTELPRQIAIFYFRWGTQSRKRIYIKSLPGVQPMMR